MSRSSRHVPPVVRIQQRELCNLTDTNHDRLRRLAAMSFRPGDHTGTFHNKLFRPVGAAVLCFQSYEQTPPFHGFDPTRRILLVGFRATAQNDGSVSYHDNRFFYDVKQPSHARARGRTINADKNPTLLRLAVDMHRACFRRLDDSYRLPPVPMFPRIQLGFAPTQLPEYEETPALQAATADRLGIPVGRIDSLMLREKQLRSVWEDHLIFPGQHGNNTGHVLMDAELCSQYRQSLAVYEDFRDLVGMPTWNPAREVLKTVRDNPAKRVLERRNIAHADLESLDGEVVEVLIAEMRRAIGVGADIFSFDDICRALCNPAEPIQATGVGYRKALELVGEEQAIQGMRRLLMPHVLECVTDEDLLVAARNPKEPLMASGMCKVQVIYKQNLYSEAAHCFTPKMLNRKITANLYRAWSREEIRDVPASLPAEQHDAGSLVDTV